MIVDYKTFIRCCPSSATPSPELFNTFAEAIAKADGEIRSLVGDEIYTRLEAVPLENTGAAVAMLSLAAVSYICNRAYCDALPHLDLVLTPTGFGVVSNANVAPASADRVNRLRAHLERNWLTARMSLLEGLVATDEGGWRDSPQAVREISSSLFWRKVHYGMLGKVITSVAELEELHPKIALAETNLATVISTEMFRSVLDAQRHLPMAVEMAVVASLCRKFVVAVVSDSGDADAIRRSILDHLTRNIDSFPAFKNSSVFAAIKSTRYENAEDDPCFFFA